MTDELTPINIPADCPLCLQDHSIKAADTERAGMAMCSGHAEMFDYDLGDIRERVADPPKPKELVKFTEQMEPGDAAI